MGLAAGLADRREGWLARDMAGDGFVWGDGAHAARGARGPGGKCPQARPPRLGPGLSAGHVAALGAYRCSRLMRAAGWHAGLPGLRGRPGPRLG